MNLKTLSLKTIKNGLDFLTKHSSMKNVRKREDLQLFLTKLTENMPDSSNAKEYYNYYLKKK